jgi:hypothetical protein
MTFNRWFVRHNSHYDSLTLIQIDTLEALFPTILLEVYKLKPQRIIFTLSTSKHNVIKMSAYAEPHQDDAVEAFAFVS